MKKVILYSVAILLLSTIVYYFIKVPFIILDNRIYYKESQVGDYTLYSRKRMWCSDATESVYSDSKYVYKLDCKSSQQYRLVNNFEVLTLQAALEKHRVPPKELMDAIPELYRYNKVFN